MKCPLCLNDPCVCRVPDFKDVMMKIGQIFKNRNETWRRLEELGFDMSDCIALGEHVVWHNVSILWLKHADHFSIFVRCPECLDVFGQIYSAGEILNGVVFPSSHKCNPYRFLRRLANIIADITDED